MNQLKSIVIPPLSRCQGVLRVPGSKSLTNRALLLASFCSTPTRIHLPLESDDTNRMVQALKALGVHIKSIDAGLVVSGGQRFFTGDTMLATHILDLGNAGTAMRPLLAALAINCRRELTLTGDQRMKERPIGPLVDSLIKLGCQIEYLENPGFPPLAVKPRRTENCSDSIEIDGSLSSQFVSALLMALPWLDQSIDLKLAFPAVSKPYIAMTIKIMAEFGIQVREQGQSFCYQSGSSYQSPGTFLIEADASSASYFWAAAAIAAGPIEVQGISQDSLQGDVLFCQALADMGASVRYGADSITVTGQPLVAIDIDCNHIPDAAMTLAMVALYAKGTTRIRNIYNWRIKETDRLEAMACELTKLGAKVVCDRDQLTITGPICAKDPVIDTYNDHRMAMCFSLAAFAGQPVVIHDPSVTSKTYPNYFKDFLAICT